MIVGIPKGLLHCKYNVFFESFFKELGSEIVSSEDTNKEILNLGAKFCVDDACLPVKIFHGHVASISEKADVILIPRIMQLEKREYICPKFCGLPEMVVNSVPNMPKIISEPIYNTSNRGLYKWAKKAGRKITNDRSKIKKSFNLALKKQNKFKPGIKSQEYNTKVALVGHPYNIYDNFTNMNIVKKLNQLEVGVVTEESVKRSLIEKEARELYKRPFWTFAKTSYGFALNSVKKGDVKGIIYISSFACGIDSIIIQLIRDKIGLFPLMVIKLDEHTGEVGLNTRIEAFVDMLERSLK